MTKQFWSQYDHAKHMAKTISLSRSARCAYYDLYNACFIEGGFILDHDEELARRTGASIDEWLMIRPALERMFVVDRRGWHNADLLAAMQEAEAKIQQKKTAGRLGGKSKALRDKANQASTASISLCKLDSDLHSDSEPEGRTRPSLRSI